MGELGGLCDIGHQGLLLDKEFGLYYNRARYLNPRLGRFMQRDPAGYVDGMSLYEYVHSTPILALDPIGLAWGTSDFVYHYWFGKGKAVDYPVRQDRCR